LSAQIATTSARGPPAKRRGLGRSSIALPRAARLSCSRQTRARLRSSHLPIEGRTGHGKGGPEVTAFVQIRLIGARVPGSKSMEYEYAARRLEQAIASPKGDDEAPDEAL